MHFKKTLLSIWKMIASHRCVWRVWWGGSMLSLAPQCHQHPLLLEGTSNPAVSPAFLSHVAYLAAGRGPCSRALALHLHSYYFVWQPLVCAGCGGLSLASASPSRVSDFPLLVLAAPATVTRGHWQADEPIQATVCHCPQPTPSLGVSCQPGQTWISPHSLWACPLDTAARS